MKLKIIKDTEILNLDMALAIGIGSDYFIGQKVGKFDPDERCVNKALKILVKTGDEIKLKEYEIKENAIYFKVDVREKFQLGADRIDDTQYKIDKNNCVIEE